MTTALGQRVILNRILVSCVLTVEFPFVFRNRQSFLPCKETAESLISFNNYLTNVF